MNKFNLDIVTSQKDKKSNCSVLLQMSGGQMEDL